VEQTTSPQSCFECHSDTTTFLVAATAQWEHSKHASGETLQDDGRIRPIGLIETLGKDPVGLNDRVILRNGTTTHRVTQPRGFRDWNLTSSIGQAV
jgi:hypothetical protein